MQTTYRAMQVSKSGLLELVDRPVPTSDISDVLTQVEACEVPHGINRVILTNFSWIANE